MIMDDFKKHMEKLFDSIIDKAQYYIDRKLSSKDMLGMKFGMNDRLIRKAANIYDAALRTKYKANLNS